MSIMQWAVLGLILLIVFLTNRMQNKASMHAPIDHFQDPHERNDSPYTDYACTHHAQEHYEPTTDSSRLDDDSHSLVSDDSSDRD